MPVSVTTNVGTWVAISIVGLIVGAGMLLTLVFGKSVTLLGSTFPKTSGLRAVVVGISGTAMVTLSSLLLASVGKPVSEAASSAAAAPTSTAHSTATPSTPPAQTAASTYAANPTKTSALITPDGTTPVGPTPTVQVHLNNVPPRGQGGVWLLVEPLSDDNGVAIASSGLDYLFTTKTSLEDDPGNFSDGVWSNTIQIGDPQSPNYCASVTSERLIVVLVDASEDKSLAATAIAVAKANPDSPEYGTSLPPGDSLASVTLKRSGKC